MFSLDILERESLHLVNLTERFEVTYAALQELEKKEKAFAAAQVELEKVFLLFFFFLAISS